jgi:hypothetical protein
VLASYSLSAGNKVNPAHHLGINIEIKKRHNALSADGQSRFRSFDILLKKSPENLLVFIIQKTTSLAKVACTNLVKAALSNVYSSK